MNARFERGILWSTLKFERCSSGHTTDDEFGSTTKGVTNSTIESVVIVGTMKPISLPQSELKMTSVHTVVTMCSNNVLKEVTNRHGRTHKAFFHLCCSLKATEKEVNNSAGRINTFEDPTLSYRRG
jgi:hypothetical protein